MIRRFVMLGVFVALLGVGDVSARAYVQAKADDLAHEKAPPGSTITTSIGAFPFVPRLALSTSVSHVGVHVENLDTTAITFAQVNIDLRNVKLDRSELLSKRKVKITSIDSGTISATVTSEGLSKALHIPVTIADGVVNVTLLGRTIPVTPSMSATGKLTLTGPAGRSFKLTIPKTDYVPCLGEITVLAGRIKLSCQIHEIPPALIEAAQGA